jgi:recombination protein RecA
VSAQILTLELPALPVLSGSDAVPLAEQLPVGRLVEIARTADGAQMTMAIACVRQAQAQGEPVVWVQRAGGSLFPPDLADSGIDLDALLIVHVGLTTGKGTRPSCPAGKAVGAPPNRGVASLQSIEHDMAKAAELTLRSGGFGLVVIDLTAVPAADANADCAPPQAKSNGLELAVQSRLLGLAREHRCQVLFLSERGSRGGSLGPLISLCIEPRRTRVGRGEFAVAPHARKDKSGLLCALAVEARRGPWGLW